MKQDTTKRTDIYFKRNNLFERETSILNGRNWKSNGKIQTWKGSQRNLEIIKDYQTHLLAKGDIKYTVGKHTATLRKITDMLNKDLDHVTKKDVDQLIGEVYGSEKWSEHTKRDYIRHFKQFYNWFEDEDPRLNKADNQEARKFYSYLRKLKRPSPKTKRDPSTVISDEECLIQIRKGCRNNMERAFIAFLHETGARIGETLNVRIRDIEYKEKHALVRVDGKTGERRIPIIKSLPWIHKWLQDHMSNDDKNSLLWISPSYGHKGKPLRYTGACKILKRTMDRCGVGKKCNPHWYRHSRASLLASKYTDQIACELMGWEIGSKQIKTYTHISAKQVEDVFLEKENLKPQEKPKPSYQECVCGYINPSDGRYCHKCGNPLSTAIVLEDEAKKNDAISEAMEAFAKIMSNEDLKKKFESFIKSK